MSERVNFFHPINRIIGDSTSTKDTCLYTTYNLVDYLLSSPFASSCYRIAETPSGENNKRAFQIISPANDLPLGRFGYVSFKIVLVACFFFAWKEAAFLTLVALTIKYYARSTELYTPRVLSPILHEPPPLIPEQQQGPNISRAPQKLPNPALKEPLTQEEKEQNNIARWQQKTKLQLLYFCFVLGNTELDVINSQAPEMVHVCIGSEFSQYPLSFLLKIPFFNSFYQRWRQSEKKEIHLSINFPYKHKELHRLQELHEKAALIPDDIDPSYLCLDKASFFPTDSSSRFKALQSETFQDYEFVHFYFPQSLPTNFKTNPPVSKMISCQFKLLPSIHGVEDVNKSNDTIERQKNVIKCLKELQTLSKTDRCYYSNKVFNEFISSLSDDINLIRNRKLDPKFDPWDPWEKLQEVLYQCKGVQDYITILDFPPTFKFHNLAWDILKQFSNLLWIQIKSPKEFYDTIETYSSVRVVSIETTQSLPSDFIDRVFPNVEIYEIG